MTATTAPDAGRNAAELLRDWLACHRRVFALTGAGCSTASGIPDYRDAKGVWKRRPPVTFQAFTGDAATYRRYWARSGIGWPRFARAQPNDAHRALADWEDGGTLSLLVTQNVDGLHQCAGSRLVIDLHGRLDRVVCLGCAETLPREAVQVHLEEANPGWHATRAEVAPDGDADIDDDDAIAHFVPPRCRDCDGLLKPDVVFFGENVPRARYEHARVALQASDAMLVVGSSLMVYSGYRFARMAREAGLPLAILNQGTTRADAIATLKLDAGCGETLRAVLDWRLSG
ncbi:MAG: NAD-dependent protein deacetylase [Pseudomonadota bacterium]|nr:NAD-dependent protein deacetylase [Pseudomonadota bacterium]